MEFFVHDMKNLPVVVDKRLAELRRMDAHFNALSKKAAAEEAKLLDEVTALAKTNPDFDEEPVLEKFNAIMRCRQEAQVAADEQVKKIQKLYDLLDGRITFIDSCTKDIGHLLPQGSLERGGSIRKKKRKKTGQEDAQSQSMDEVLIDGSAVAYDPNEPVYCTCRQISFGNMIACENTECPIEWFHFGCVGLTAEPNEPWYCAQCRENM